MADIELVIKIPEGLKMDFESEQWTALSCMEMKDALKKATLLPKGHGKLFDENKLKKEMIRCECSRAMYDTLDYVLSYMKPIVKADKEAKDV